MNEIFFTDVEANLLRKFLTDKRLNTIKESANKFNLFDVFGFARNEIRHSFFLKWLLDPKENHGLGGSFIKALVTNLVSSEPERYDRSFYLLMMDCSDFIVQREKQNIDLFLYSASKKVIIIIENKIDSQEHPSRGFKSQLDKYRDYVEKEYPDKEYIKIYVYLTPDGDPPSDEMHWQAISYSTIVEIIEEMYEDNKERIEQGAKMLIENYIEMVRRDIMEENDLKKLCNDIYTEHRKALDLIYKYSDMGMSHTERLVTEVLKEYSLNVIEYDPDIGRNVFHTPAMTAFLPKLKEPNSSWSTVYTYNYWFKIDDHENGRVSFVFELGFYGVDESTRQKLDALADTRNPRNKKKGEKYKRIETFAWKTFKDDDEQNKELIKEEIAKVLKEEPKWIEEAKKVIMAYSEI